MVELLPTIGFCEYVDLPKWKVFGLRAKIDTGARSSALHVENLYELADNKVHFDVRLDRRRAHRRVSVVAPIVRKARVRPSSGISHLRIFVKAQIRIGTYIHNIEVSLVDRQNMIFRMLIGRSALEHRFLVDVSRRYVLGARPDKPSRSRGEAS